MKHPYSLWLLLGVLCSSLALGAQVRDSETPRTPPGSPSLFWFNVEVGHDQRAHQARVTLVQDGRQIYSNRYAFRAPREGGYVLPLFSLDSRASRSVLRSAIRSKTDVKVQIEIDSIEYEVGVLADYRWDEIPWTQVKPRTIPLNESQTEDDATTSRGVGVLSTHCCSDQDELAAYDHYALCQTSCQGGSMGSFEECVASCAPDYVFCLGQWTTITERIHQYYTSGYSDCRNVGGAAWMVRFYSDVGVCRDGWRRTWLCDGTAEDFFGSYYDCNKDCRRVVGPACPPGPWDSVTEGCD